MRPVREFLALALLFLAARSVPAQTLYGSIVGNVTDESSAVVPNATVKITHVETNQSRETRANETGGYTFSTVPAGTYQVSISNAGFQTFVAKDIVVASNSVVRVNAVMHVGSVANSIEVTAEAAVLQSDRADVKSELTHRTLENVPVSGRSYQSLFVMMPGVTQPSYFQYGGINNPSRSMTVTVNGTLNTDVVVRIDGVSATNQHIQSLQAYSPSLEAIESVNVVTSSFDAEQGMAGGASVNVQVKSGTNSLHGSAFENVTNRAMRARAFFLPAGYPKGQDNNNVFGGTAGGPFVKNKLFYFVSVESAIERRLSGGGAGTFQTIPNASVRNGDFSATGTTVYDPKTGNPNGTARTPFPNSIIPADRVNASALKWVAYLPPVTFPGLSVRNYYTTQKYSTNFTKLDSKVNWNASSKLGIYGRFSYLPDSEGTTGWVPGNDNPISLPRYTDATVISTAVGANYTVSPRFLVDGVYGFTRQHTLQYSGTETGPCWGDKLGVPGACVKRDIAPPTMTISSWAGLGAIGLFDYLDPQYQYAGNGQWVKGSHSIRFGADYHVLHYNHYETYPQFPTMTFTGGITALSGGAAPNQYNSWADFLLGSPANLVTSVDHAPLNGGADPMRPATVRTKEFGLYIRDQWQVSRKFTASVGLRWEYYPVPVRADRGIEFYNFATDKLLICGVGGNPGNCGVHVSPKQFSPRLGLAYRVTDTFVVRAGFSLNSQQDNLWRYGTYAFPTVQSVTQAGANSFSPGGSLSDGFPVIQELDISSGSLSLPPGSGVTTLPKDFIRGYVASWNFTVQKSFAHNWTAQAGYVATRGIHLFDRQNVNYGQPGGGAASQPFFSKGIVAAVNVLNPLNHSYYDSLQASLNRRLASGLTVNAGYTWSKNISAFAGTIPIPEYFKLNRGLVGPGALGGTLGMVGDTPHKLTAAFTAQAPFGKGKRFLNQGGAASKITGGWQLNGLFTSMSGTPFTVTASAASLNAPGSSQQADLVKPNVQILGGVGLNNPFFDPTAFASVTQARFGTSGFNNVRGPGAVNLDASLFREFRATERLTLQFRAEAFNITNTPHFAIPSNLNVSTVSRNTDGSVNLNGFASITSVQPLGRNFDERQFRLGMRLGW